MNWVRQTALLIGMMFFAQIGQIGRAEVLYSDTFSAPDGVTPEGWKIAEEPISRELFWKISDEQFNTGNGDNIPTPDGYSFALIGIDAAAQWKDVEIKCSFWMPQNNGQVLLVGRWQDRNNHYQAYLVTNEGQRMIGIDKVVKGQHISLGRVVHGVEGAKIPKVENAQSRAESHLFIFTIVGDRLEVQLDDQLYIITNDNRGAPYAVGAPGLGLRYNEIHFDNVIVSSAVTGGATAPPVGAQSGYRVAIKRKLTLIQANQLKKDLLAKDLQDVDIVENGAEYDVFVSSFLSLEEAERYRKTLASRGIRSVAAVEITKTGDVRLPEDKDQTFKILMKVYDDPTPAERLKMTLIGDGYSPVTVIQALGKHQVVVGNFETRAEASKLAQVLEKDGYIVAEILASDILDRGVIADSGTNGQILPFDELPAKILESAAWKRTTEEDKRKVLEFVRNETIYQTKRQIADEIAKFEKQFEEMKGDQQNLVLLIREEQKAREKAAEAEAQLVAQLLRVDELIKQETDAAYAEAEKLLTDIAATHPTEAQIPLKRSLINFKRNGVFPGSNTMKSLVGDQRVAMIKQLGDEAERQYNQEAYELALTQYTTYKTLLNPTTEKARLDEAQLKIKDITEKLKEKARLAALKYQQLDDKVAATETPLLYLKFGIFGLGGGMVFLMLLMFIGALRRKRQHRDMLAQLQNITMQPSMPLPAGAASSQIAGGQTSALPPSPVVPQLSTPADPAEYQTGGMPSGNIPADDSSLALDNADQEVTQFEEPSGLGGDGEDFSLSLMAETEPPPRQRQPSSARGMSESTENEIGFTLGEGFDLGDEPKLTATESPAEELPMTPFAPAVEESLEPLQLEDLEDIVPEPVAETAPPLPPPTTTSGPEPFDELSLTLSDTDDDAEAPPPADESNADTLVVGPPLFDDLPPVDEEDTLITAPPAEDETGLPPLVDDAPTPAATATASNEIFSQNFDDEVVGATPANWVGEYEYASLTASDVNSAGNAGLALRFDKPTGEGRAYYCCTVPEAKGRFKVEFDIRCNDKNKYLLGFYIEQDQDFKRSIHTIIHRTDEQTSPMLRMQGVPIPFEMEKWVHVRYDINLLAGTLNGYADGQLVVSNAKLDNAPDCINTLAIRDNNPTTGVLLIDNITIVRL